MNFFKKFFTSIIDLFYPRHCAGCQRALLEKEKFLCAGCEQQLQPLTAPCCQVCSFPLVSVDLPTCSNCAERKLHFIAGVSAFRYQGLMQELLARYKYGHDQSLRPLLQELIVAALQDERLQGVNFAGVVPVPLHPLRERERGFNQVLPLAQEIAKQKKLPLQFLLKRKNPTRFQASFNRQKRLENLEGVFALRLPQQVHGNYLLVDDVLTTGSTLDECSKILLEAGAQGVWAVVLAR